MSCNRTVTQLWNLQMRVGAWVLRTFGSKALSDREERGLRLVEESVELAQAVGIDKERLHLIIDRVYERPVGDVKQEVGGVFTTLAAAATACNVDLDLAAEAEVARVESKDPEHFRNRNREKAALGMGNYPEGYAS